MLINIKTTIAKWMGPGSSQQHPATEQGATDTNWNVQSSIGT